MSWRVGVDTGGTFTDLAAVETITGEVVIHKVPSTPETPADAIVAALEFFEQRTGVTLDALDMLAHGTTVATNALLEQKGVKAGLLITEGFSAIYLARAGTRPRGADLIDPRYQKAPMLVPLALTFEIPERISFDGHISRPLDAEAVRSAARALNAQGVSAVAICFLFCFMSDVHEQETAQILKEELPGCRVSLSSEVMPVIREFPRLSTTVLDAYVGPVVEAYFRDLSSRMSHSRVNVNRLFIMQSNGGLMRINVAARYPNETLLSGPAAGVTFAAELGRVIGQRNIVNFDMGGTSTDISLIVNGKPTTVNHGHVAGQEVGTPMLEITTLGAGGGGIAALGEDGLLKVGPESAGANPGPACYDLGGTRPTVTDANVLLGYLDPTRFLGGRLAGTFDLAQQTLATLGEQLNLDAIHAALGVRRVVNAHMAGGLRLKITEKGGDPRNFVLVAFGGAGPLHAAELARELGIPRVVIPAFPGVACAMGLLLADVRHIYRQSYLKRLSSVDIGDINARFLNLKERAFQDAAEEGFPPEEIVLQAQMEVRYAHQGYQLTIEVPQELTGTDDLQAVRRSFDQVHEATYGVAAPGEEAELVTLRLLSIGPMPKMQFKPPATTAHAGGPEPRDCRQAYFPDTNSFVDLPVFERTDLAAGTELEGPLVIEQQDSTCLLAPGQRLAVDAQGNLIIEA
ncbi:MAG: hydantoinase/oxoprolinase family protein [Hyphomicrobiales bacterium]|nr:hydantoinase/oxoprolinase family protein [Hyphomicrobiales bacterium]